MNSSTVKQHKSKSVRLNATTEAANATSTKEPLATSKNELESVVNEPVDSSTSKQQEVKPVPTKVAIENPIATSDGDKPALANDVLGALLNDPSSAIKGSNRFATVRELNSKFSIVNHVNSKRGRINKDVQEKLNLVVGDVVQINVKDKMVLLSKSSTDEGLVMKEHGNLYSKELVDQVTAMFQFDFSQQSTHHLTKVTFQNWNDQLVAILTP